MKKLHLGTNLILIGFFSLSLFTANCGWSIESVNNGPAAPTVTTLSASGVTTDGATLNGAVNPNGLDTVAWFEWGESPDNLNNSTQSQIVGSGKSLQQVSASITGLSPQTTYYFRTVASNNDGTSYGEVQVFTTASASNSNPVVQITSPSDGANFNEGETISFSGTATDQEDGDLTSSIVWTSSLDGQIGTGGRFSLSNLSPGTHTITATVTDSGGQTGSDSVTVHVHTESHVLVGAGDIAVCSSDADDETARLLDQIDSTDGIDTVITFGDNAYPDGTNNDFLNCYDPTWGRYKWKTKPSPGNHEYHTKNASGYFNYFGSAAGDPSKGYYSYDVGSWHIVVLNSECSEIGGCGKTSPQGQWLAADLAAHKTDCTLAYWHRPLFSSGSHGNNPEMREIWEILYDAGVDIVLNGHDHLYERFDPQDPYGNPDPDRGIREFVVGTGGGSLYSFGTIQPNSAVRNNKTHGVLKLTLHSGSYEWEFVPINGKTFTDYGSASCVTIP